MIARRIRERCEQFARDENVYDCGHPENGDYVKVDSLVSLYSELLAEKERELKDYISAAEADRRIGERQCDELTDKLAEKDREIELKETELGKLDAELIVLNAAYQHLTAQAVSFAETLAENHVEIDGYADWEEAQAFLKEHL